MKTTVVKGVLTSYELMFAILSATILCGSDAVKDPVTGQIITSKWKQMVIGGNQ